MVAVDIWVEGDSDRKFLADVISLWFDLTFDKEYKGSDKSHNTLIQIREGKGVSTFTSPKKWQSAVREFEQSDKMGVGVRSLIIIDADADFDKRKNEVAKTVIGINFDPENHLFLIPDHQNAGNLETLLEQIINPEHKILFECWNAYEACLQSKETREYTLPPRKAKIYAYLEALLGEKEKQKIKPEERNYSDPDHWNLDHTKEPLKPLYEFLKKHLVP